MSRLSIFCLTSVFGLAAVCAWSGEVRWRSNPLRLQAVPQTRSESPTPLGTPRIQLQQPAPADVESPDAAESDVVESDAVERDAECERSAVPPVDEPRLPATQNDRAVTAAPRAVSHAAKSPVSGGQSNPAPTIMRRLPSVIAPPPLATGDISGLQLRAARSATPPKASAPLPPAPAASLMAEDELRQDELPREHQAIVDLPAPPGESTAEKPPALWKRFVRFPKIFKKSSHEPVPPGTSSAVAENTDAAESEQGKKGSWFGSLGQRMFEAPPPPQWMQERMAKHGPAVAGGDHDR